MRIALIGIGLSGLATGWFLLKNFSMGENFALTFFDSAGIGGGTSGMAAGLLHPFVGASAKLNRHGLEGYSATKKLLDLASEKLGKPVFNPCGLLRLAITERQKHEYRLSAESNQELIWQVAEETQKKIPSMGFHPGIFNKNSITVDCPLYLEGLWRACQERGATFEKRSIDSLDELKDFDHIVLAAGALVNKLLPASPLPITAVKGQVIELAWPKDLPPLPFALSSQAYLLMDKEKNSCIAGATYERNFDSALSDISYASKDIMPKAAALIPALKDVSILSCKAGVRASTPDHMPIVQKVGSKCWVITGMGSKGLLYHALYGEQLAAMIARE